MRLPTREERNQRGSSLSLIFSKHQKARPQNVHFEKGYEAEEVIGSGYHHRKEITYGWN
jgi:hypothetical protein